MLGCSLNDSDNQSEVDESLIEDYLTTNNINAEKDMTGYYYSVVNENTSGDPIESDDIVSVYYTMTLLDGQEVGGIDPDTDPPAKFKMADKSLIPVGLRYGTSRMKVGEKYRFFIPSNLAYEFYSYDNILPPYSILIVESEVVKIESEETQKLIEKDSIDNFIAATNMEDMLETDSGLYFKRTSDEGSGDVPAPGTSVRIKYSAKYLGGNLFKETGDDETLGFVVGNSTVIEGLQEGVQLMKEGETATIIVPSYLAFDESLQVFPELFREDLLDHDLITEETPPFSILEIAVELVEIL
jgi:FKBP-type peptidyl-prolyl cis-trans isomerase